MFYRTHVPMSRREVAVLCRGASNEPSVSCALMVVGLETDRKEFFCTSRSSAPRAGIAPMRTARITSLCGGRRSTPPRQARRTRSTCSRQAQRQRRSTTGASRRRRPLWAASPRRTSARSPSCRSAASRRSRPRLRIRSLPLVAMRLFVHAARTRGRRSRKSARYSRGLLLSSLGSRSPASGVQCALGALRTARSVK